MASKGLTDTSEDSKLVYRRKRPKVDTLFFLFFPTRPRLNQIESDFRIKIYYLWHESAPFDYMVKLISEIFYNFFP